MGARVMKAIGLLVALAGLVVGGLFDPNVGALDPAMFGLTPHGAHVLYGVSWVVLIVYALLTDPEKVKSLLPGVKPPLVGLLLLAALPLTSCGGKVLVQPPPGTYDAVTSRQYQADQIIKALDAVVLVARHLNATTGRLHLPDLDTAVILKSADAVGKAAESYGNGSSAAASVRKAVDAFLGSISIDARQHPTLAPVLAGLVAALNVVAL